MKARTQRKADQYRRISQEKSAQARKNAYAIKRSRDIDQKNKEAAELQHFVKFPKP
jgi:hypothetical protein